jgi:uncharacterized protein (DUF1778 family)
MRYTIRMARDFVLTVRLNGPEKRTLMGGAMAKDIRLAEFVRRAAMDEAEMILTQARHKTTDGLVEIAETINAPDSRAGRLIKAGRIGRHE